MKIVLGKQYVDNDKFPSLLIDTFKKNSMPVEIIQKYNQRGILKYLADNDDVEGLILQEYMEELIEVPLEFINKVLEESPNTKLVFIISDRHKSDKKYLSTLYQNKIYNVLFEEDSLIDSIVNLLVEPRKPKDAKTYFNIDDEYLESKDTSSIVSQQVIETIISYLYAVETQEELNNRYDDLVKRYSEIENIKILKHIPLEIKEHLKDNENYLKFTKIDTPKEQVETSTKTSKIPNLTSIFNRERKVEEKERRPKVKEKKEIKEKNEKKEVKREVQILEKEVPVVTEKVITKEVIKHVSSMPSDYRKLVAFLGNRQKGKTSIIDLLATYFSEEKKKVAVLDFTDNKDFFFFKCWCNTENQDTELKRLDLLSNGAKRPFEVDERYHVYTQKIDIEEDFDLYGAIENIKYDYDIILIDVDFFSFIDELRFLCNDIYFVHDLNIIDLRELKRKVKDLLDVGVNSSRLKFIINKSIKASIKPLDILKGISQPIQEIEDDNKENYLELMDNRVFSLSFSLELFENQINSLFKGKEETSIPNELIKEVQSIANDIYPISTTTNGLFKSLFGKIKK